jgi:hypothetical protein
MSIFARTIVRTARLFDGSTPETTTGWSKPLKDNATYTFKADVTTPVGSWSTKDLGVRAADRPLALWFRLDGTPNPGTSLLTHKTARTGDTNPAYVPTNLLLEQFPLTTKLQGPIIINATDRVCVTHDEGGACSVEFLALDAAQAAELGLIRDLTSAPDVDCCSRESITVTESTDLAAWGSKELVVFVDAPSTTLPAEINMPALADLEIGQSALFVRIGGALAYVGTNVVGDAINGQVNQAFELPAFAAVRVTREELTFSATAPILAVGTSLNNQGPGVPGLVIDLPTPTAPSMPVQTNFAVRTLVRCPPTALMAVGDEIPLIWASGTGPIVIIPRNFETLNGEVDGRAYYRSVDMPVIKKTFYGLIVVGSGDMRASPIATYSAGAAVIGPYHGTQIVRLTEAAAQSATLPDASFCQPEALLVIECIGGAKTINRAAADVINGRGAAGATNVVAPAGTILNMRPNPAGFWSVI